MIVTALNQNHESVPALQYNMDNAQKINIGSIATQSAAINSRVVTLTSTIACYLAWGSNPLATGNSGNDFLAPGVKFSLLVKSTDKISVIAFDPGETGALFILPAASE